MNRRLAVQVEIETLHESGEGRPRQASVDGTEIGRRGHQQRDVLLYPFLHAADSLVSGKLEARMNGLALRAMHGCRDSKADKADKQEDEGWSVSLQLA